MNNPSGAGGRYDGPGVARGKFARVYAPTAHETEGDTARVPGSPNSRTGDPVERAKFRGEGSVGTSYVEYAKAWRDSRQRAEEDLSKQKIPARLKQLIRNYYGTGR